MPSATFIAANRLVVPCRTSWVRRSGMPGIIGSAGWERASACPLGFLIHAQRNGGLRGVQVEPDDVVDLLHEQRVGGQFEPLGAVRLHAQCRRDSLTDWVSPMNGVSGLHG